MSVSCTRFDGCSNTSRHSDDVLRSKWIKRQMCEYKNGGFGTVNILLIITDVPDVTTSIQYSPTHVQQVIFPAVILS